MSNFIIPPHLKMAESVTDEEYLIAIRERRIVVTILIIVGIIITLMFVFHMGLLTGIPISAAILAALERILNRLFKNAHKVSTTRMARYKELKAYKERINNKLGGQ